LRSKLAEKFKTAEKGEKRGTTHVLWELREERKTPYLHQLLYP
jgi:hypothetical protein